MKRTLAWTTLAVLALSGYSFALINPNFTPVDLMDGAETVLLVKLSEAGAKDKVSAEIVRVIKGKEAKGGKLTIDIGSDSEEMAADKLKKMAKAPGDEPVLVFIGEDEEGRQAVYLHIRTLWLRLEKTEADEMLLLEEESMMSGTWAGSTDMLVRLIDYMLIDDMVDVPVHWGAEWGDQKKLGKIEGKVHDLQAVDIEGNGERCVFVAAETGDRLHRYDRIKKEFMDVSGKRRLSSKSRIAAWGDFNGDGRLDLASSDGPGVYLQKKDGSFSAVSALPSNAVKGPCAGLAVLDVGKEGKAGLLITTVGAPWILTPNDDGSFSAAALARKKGSGEDLGKPGESLIADFDGDHMPDVLQLYEKGSWLYRGKGAGTFADGNRCAPVLGTSPASAALGDYDADGKLDVLCVAPLDVPRLWQNLGGGKFSESLESCGSLAYISKRGGLACGTCDINNDGRQDLYIMYTDMYPQIFFNRGFRCFGFARELTAGEAPVVPNANMGQQAGVIADLDGDGAQDFALALLNGEVWAVLRPEEDGNLGVDVKLPPGKGYVGPLTVTGWNFERPLGAWNVVAGGAGAFFGLPEAGPCLIRWQIPGEKPRKKELVVEKKPVGMTIR